MKAGTWLLFSDGSIGVLLRDELNRPVIASGDPGNYTAYDHYPAGLVDAIEVGRVEYLDTYEAAIAQVRRMREYADRLLKNIEQ